MTRARFLLMDATAEFVRLWTRHQGEVERYVYMMVPRAADAAEVLQEVSVKLWEKWDQYDRERPLVPWAMKFAWLEVLKWRQRQGRERLVFSGGLLEQLNALHDDEVPLMEARRRALEGCLGKLSGQERKWVEMRYSKHGAVKEEAARSGVSLHKLYYALERIRARLVDCVERTMKREGWEHA